jgi:predicted O-methyltransferase YrrM
VSFLNYYDLHYAFKLGRRADTFRQVFQRLLEIKPHNITVVETGSLREPGNWAGDGQSTILFDELIKSTGGRVFSVDICSEHTTIARKLVSDNVILVNGNSLNFLNALSQPIDLLYLDSFDLSHQDPLPSASHHLFELLAAAKNLHTGSIVCIDDTWWPVAEPPHGKGMIVCQCLKALGAERITQPDGLQVAWVLK